MAVLRGQELAKALSPEKAKELGFSAETDFELTKIRHGLWLLEHKKAEKKPVPAEKEKQGKETMELNAKLFSMLQDEKLSERVVGKFENLLNPKELARLKELIKEGKVFEFKLSEKYKKPIYKISLPKKNTGEKTVPELPASEYCLENHGILVCTTKAKAYEVSINMQDAIKNSEIRGIKSFDGNYYIIENELLQKYKQPIAEIIQANKSISLGEIHKKAGVSKILAKIACEFLKDDGEIIEKRGGHYQYV